MTSLDPALTAADHPVPQWRGVNHLALLTADMDATVRFYVGVLGMDLAAAIKAGAARHYFFTMGTANTVAFFEWPGHEIVAKGAGAPPRPEMQLDHISFDLPDSEALIALRDRLRAAGSEATDIVDHGFIRSIYFTDNNGIALEASCWIDDATAPGADTSRFVTDPDPVPAVRELLAEGRVRTVPATRLV